MEWWQIFFLAWAIVLVLLILTVKWVPLEEKRSDLNTLCRCRRCKGNFRKYQNDSRCPKCSVYFGRVLEEHEIFPWMDSATEYPKLTRIAFIKYLRLQRLLVKEDYERRSMQAFREEWDRMHKDEEGK